LTGVFINLVFFFGESPAENYEKALLLTPVIFRGDYHCFSGADRHQELNSGHLITKLVFNLLTSINQSVTTPATAETNVTRSQSMGSQPRLGTINFLTNFLSELAIKLKPVD
jgi:hypothetical protein